MEDSISERRLVENEMIFRQHNERILEGLDELEKLAKTSQQEEYIYKADMPLQFYCECADEKCRRRIEVKQSQYKTIHQKRERFVVVCGHEDNRIERLIKKEANYCVIEKLTPPPATTSGPHSTDRKNI